MKSKNLIVIISSVVVLLTLFFIYPTVYKYDKINQKFPVRINRITGSTQILYMDGWQSVDKSQPSENQLKDFRNELLLIIDENNSNIKQEIIDQIKGEIVSQVQDDLYKVREDINQYKKFEIDPDNYFTIGSTQDKVKKIMGVPTGTDDYFHYWYYGNSRITFKNNKVNEYSNLDGNLRVR